MSVVDKSNNVGKSNKKKTVHIAQQKNLYNQLLITRTIPISITNIGDRIKETLEKAISAQIEGKCIVEGYIKPRSVEVITFSSGLVMGSNVIFEVVIQCEVCSPVEGMHIKCVAKHINKAGIRAEINETPSPVIIFIARDHNYASPLFAEVNENDEIKVRVIGQRFELNDKYISIIAEIVESNTESEKEEERTIAKPTTNMAKPLTSVAKIKAPLSIKAFEEPNAIETPVPVLVPSTKKKATIRTKIKINN